MTNYKSISTTTITNCQFSICTIVSDMNEYLLMKHSFEDCGFTGDCEYIIADNSEGNKLDACQAINFFIRESTANYLIIVHQDVRCIDNRIILEKCLTDLSAIDSKWAVCGNAGAIGYHQLVYYINNAGKIMKNSNLPARVISLDENMLILKRATGVSASSNLSGFHLYGTDLCINADFLGYNCYVIPFMVNHLSLGNLKDLDKHINSFILSYGSKISGRFIQTTCTKFYLSNSPLKNRIYNYPFIFFFLKAIQRLKLFFKRLLKANPHKKISTSE